ncbi:TPA: hypothetical protein P8P07_005849 [Pseudomonas aeruginosa]|nr:hypothetical protein [Pseudomonas aeruginosa]
MSLETQIAALVTAANNLTGAVNGKMNEIDQKVAAATGAVPAQINARLRMLLYVDPVSGSNANTGASFALAKKTIAGAISEVPSGGFATIYLKEGVAHELTADISVENKTIHIYGFGHIWNDRNSYVEIVSAPSVVADGSLAGGGIVLGLKGFMFFQGIKFSTVKFNAEHVGKVNNIYQTAMFKTNISNGVMQMQHCQMDLRNGAFTYQHSGGSFGKTDLLMRNVLINKIDISGQAFNTGHQHLVGTWGNQAIPFSLFGVEMVRQGATTWAELITQNMTNALTNLKDA